MLALFVAMLIDFEFFFFWSNLPAYKACVCRICYFGLLLHYNLSICYDNYTELGKLFHASYFSARATVKMFWSLSTLAISPDFP